MKLEWVKQKQNTNYDVSGETGCLTIIPVERDNYVCPETDIKIILMP
jgi:hypothetical protein